MPDDNDAPFSPPTDSDAEETIDDTHPATDTNIDPHEAYDEGLSGAAEVEDKSVDDQDLTEDEERP